MPRTYVEANLVQVFDAGDPDVILGSKRGETFSCSGNIRPGYTMFGTSSRANIRASSMLVPGEKEYIAGMFLCSRGEVTVAVAAGSGIPEDLRLTVTPIEVERDKMGGIIQPTRKLTEKSRILTPGEGMALYGPLFIEEDIFFDNIYVVQWGRPVNQDPRLTELAKTFPCVDGKMPRYNICVERKLVYPDLRLIGLIPNGFESTTVVRADIYVTNRMRLPEGALAGKPNVVGHFEVVANERLENRYIEEAEEFAETQEKDGVVPVRFQRGEESETPENLIRDYITREMIPLHLKEAPKNIDSKDIKHEIDIKFRE